jgi:hypothetical protein
MKKIIVLICIVLAVAGVNAVNLRSYIQQVVTDDGSNLPNVENDSHSTAPDYVYTVYITSRPKEILSTDSATATLYSPSNYIRVHRLGNGTTIPYFTLANLQLAAFSTPWAAGDTVRCSIKYIPTGVITIWDLVIPDDQTYSMGFKQKLDPLGSVVINLHAKPEKAILKDR